MFKIEESLLIKKPTFELSLLAILDQYFKEMHMLISNIHLTHVIMEENVGKVFPLETNMYDASWYKNVLVASNIIFDRFHNVIDPSIDYDKIFLDEKKCDFRALANLWNKINFVVKYNLTDSEWSDRYRKWNIAATTKKIEELIAYGVKVNQPLIEVTSFDVNKYKSIPKELEVEKNFEFDNLVRVLKGEPEPEKLTVASTIEEVVEKPKANEATPTQPNQVTTPPQAATTTIEPIKDVASNKNADRGPVSPVKKEMDQLLKWVSFREEDIRAYKAKRKYGYNPEELKMIDSQLNVIKQELAFNDELLSEAKKLLPPDPMKKEMDQLLRWVGSRANDIKKYKRHLSGVGLIDDAKRLEKTIDAVCNEINNVNGLLNEAKQYLPKDPMLKELNALSRWIDLRMKDVRDYKRKIAKVNNVDDELKMIEKEMKIVDGKINDLEKDISIMNKNKPVSPEKAEMDNLLKWISNKEKDLIVAKKRLDSQKQDLIVHSKREEELERQLAETKRQLKEARDEEMLAKQKAQSLANDLEREKLANKNKESSLVVFKDHKKDIHRKPEPSAIFINEEYDNSSSNGDNSSLPPAPPSSSNGKPPFTSNRNEPLRDGLKAKQTQSKPLMVVNNKGMKPKASTGENSRITRELEQLENEMSSIKDKYQQVNKEYKDALNKYRIEAKILETAFEVLPKTLKETAINKLPSMIDHLLHEGYIKVNEDKKTNKKTKKVLVKN